MRRGPGSEEWKALLRVWKRIFRQGIGERAFWSAFLDDVVEEGESEAKNATPPGIQVQSAQPAVAVLISCLRLVHREDQLPIGACRTPSDGGACRDRPGHDRRREHARGKGKDQPSLHRVSLLRGRSERSALRDTASRTGRTTVAIARRRGGVRGDLTSCVPDERASTTRSASIPALAAVRAATRCDGASNVKKQISSSGTCVDPRNSTRVPSRVSSSDAERARASRAARSPAAPRDRYISTR